MNENIKAIEWLDDKIRIIDQTKLPQQEIYLGLTNYHQVASAIKEMKIRGAPALGVAAAYGTALGALAIFANDKNIFLKRLRIVTDAIAATRPTARNLFRALEGMTKVAEAGKEVETIKKALVAEAIRIHDEEIQATRTISELGAALIPDGATILTHCNTGPLATTGYGTALGVIIWAYEHGKKINVFATETRPLCQGARLTTWELKKAGVPVTLITDSMAGYFMSQGKINCVIVGADRITASGDTANKIGTYSVAVLAKENNLPFYVAAPTTTIDLSLATGKDIPIEERNPEEVTEIQGVRIAPEGIDVCNPAFDVTPNRYITAIITEKGIIMEPYGEGLKKILLGRL
jgi:methylthioribose-1-phosphate isomerase